MSITTPVRVSEPTVCGHPAPHSLSTLALMNGLAFLGRLSNEADYTTGLMAQGMARTHEKTNHPHRAERHCRGLERTICSCSRASDEVPEKRISHCECAAQPRDAISRGECCLAK